MIATVIPLRALPVGTHSEIESVRQRLVQLADNRPYRYKNTTAAARDAYEASKRTFVGFSESEISDCESKLHVRFPAIYRAFLNTMGRKHGDLFCGSDFATLEQLTEHREFAEKLMSENDATWELESNAVVFMEHQGYTFCFFDSSNGQDAPVYQYVEGDPSPTKRTDGFLQFVIAEIELMEHNNVQMHETGGYFVTIEDGYVSQSHPALASGVRPIELPDEIIDGNGSTRKP